MTFQAQVLTFSISSDGEDDQQQTATFNGNSITNNAAWACMQSVNVSYDSDSDDHNRGISKFIPTVAGVSNNQVKVALDFLYADDNPSKHSMHGTATVLVLADVTS